MKTICFYLVAIALSCTLIGCGKLNISDRIEPFPIPELKVVSLRTSSSGLSETAPPELISQLAESLASYSPQVSIISPVSDQILQETTVNLQLKVTDFPLFQNQNLGMGPHLNLIVDNKPYQNIYSVEQPVVLESLAPGTHTVRVFAAFPWEESLKNPGAYTETTFHVLTKTKENNPVKNLPLLTYNAPNGNYSAEPIMVDFYLTNLPREKSQPWLVQVTVNGESFLLDEWRSLYLEGFQEGNNWIKLELLDKEGNSIENTFNNTVRLITYKPGVKNTLDKIVTGEIDFENAIAIVDPNYQVSVEETPEIPQLKLVEETTPEVDLEEPKINHQQQKETTSEALELPLNGEIETIDNNSSKAENQNNDIQQENVTNRLDNIEESNLYQDQIEEIEPLEIPEELEALPEKIIVEDTDVKRETIDEKKVVDKLNNLVETTTNIEQENSNKVESLSSKTAQDSENKTLSQSNEEKIPDAIEPLVSTKTDPFEIEINLDRWVRENFEQFKNKFIEVSKLLLN